MFADGDPSGGARRLPNIFLRVDAGVPVAVCLLLGTALHVSRAAARARLARLLARARALHRSRARAEVPNIHCVLFCRHTQYRTTAEDTDEADRLRRRRITINKNVL